MAGRRVAAPAPRSTGRDCPRIRPRRAQRLTRLTPRRAAYRFTCPIKRTSWRNVGPQRSTYGARLPGPLSSRLWRFAILKRIDPKDAVATDLVYPSPLGENLWVHLQSGAPAGYYFPKLIPSEAISLRCYDAKLAAARFTAHNSFQDPPAEATHQPARA